MPGRQRADHALGPTVKRVGGAIGKFRLRRGMGPKAGLVGRKQQNGLPTVMHHPRREKPFIGKVLGKGCGQAHRRRGTTRGCVERIIEPAPCSVNNSSRHAFATRPSRITTARTPSRTA